MALSALADVEDRLQTAGLNAAYIAALITAAQALIESEVGRTVESAARSETFDPPAGSTLFLHDWPVTAISSVTEDGTGLTVDDDYVFYEDSRLVRVSGSRPIVWQTTNVQSIVVAYAGGFVTPTHDLELDHLGSLCVEVVARAFRSGEAAAIQPAAGGLRSVSLEGSDSVDFAALNSDSMELGGGLSRFVFLFEAEKAQLVGYQTPQVA